MACEPMRQYPTARALAPAADPYVFTEPPSIQTLQLHKATAKVRSVYQHQQSTTKVNRHNVNESLKKKLGINGSLAHIKLSAPPQQQPQSSPMISGGINGRTKRTPAVSLSTTVKSRQKSDFAESFPFDDCPTKPVKTSATRAPKKYAKREPKNKANNNHNLRESAANLKASLSQVPDDFWFTNERNCREDEAQAPLHMRNWFIPEISASVPCPVGGAASTSDFLPPLILARDERLELKRSELKRRTIQLRNGQQQRDLVASRRRFLLVQSSLLADAGESPKQLLAGNFSKEFRICCVDACKNESLIFTAFCPAHITKEGDQQLFRPCTAKFADHSQCRAPVFDISHEFPLCHEHARMRDNYGKQTQDVRPKKSVPSGKGKATVAARNSNSKKNIVPVSQKTTSAMPKAATLKRNNSYLNSAKQLPDPAPKLTAVVQRTHRPEMLQRFANGTLATSHLSSNSPVMMTVEQVEERDDFLDDLVDEDSIEEDSLLNHSSNKSAYATKRKSYKSISGTANQTDLLLVSENSSAYESSEDTGVGGLSESEMIEEIGFDSQFLEDPEFNTVLEDLLAVEQHGEMFDAISVDDFLADQMLRDSDGANGAHNMIVSSHVHGHTHYLHPGDSISSAPAALIQT